MTDGSSAVELRFEILGPVRAFRNGEPVDLGPPQQQAVLAILLLHAGEPVPVQRIIAALWGGDPPGNGLDVVQRYVGALRRALDPERTSLIALAPGGYVIRADGSVLDADLFRGALNRARTEHRTGDPHAAAEEVRRALGLWRTEPLAGLTGPVFATVRARLHQERAAASALLPAPAKAGPPPASPARPEPARPEPAGPKPVRPESARPDATRVESARPESARPDAARTRPARAEAARVEPVRAEATRVEPARLDPTRVEPAPLDATRVDRGRPGATRPVQSEATRVAPARPEATRVQSAPAEATRVEPARADPDPADPAYPAAVDPWAGHDLFPPDWESTG